MYQKSKMGMQAMRKVKRTIVSTYDVYDFASGLRGNSLSAYVG